MSIIASTSSVNLTEGVEYEYTHSNGGVITSAEASIVTSITIDGAYVYTKVTFIGTWIPPGSTSPVGFTDTIIGNTTNTFGDNMPLVTVGQTGEGTESTWGTITIISPRTSTMEV